VDEIDRRQKTVSIPPAKPTVIFDGDCGFCRRWVQRWRQLTTDRVDYIPFQQISTRFGELHRSDYKKAVHLIEPNGAVTRGAHAVCGILAIANRHWPLAIYDNFPGLAQIGESAYSMVADHRNLFNLLDLALLGRNVRPVTYHATRRWFLRLLGAIYFVAFISLWPQILGLVGKQGILPIAPQLRGLAGGEGTTPYFQMPTLFWINASDGMLVGVCAAGVVMAILMMARIVPVFAAFGAWLCYLSLTVAGQVFLAFQWDGLLLEAGFLAILLSPLHLLPKRDSETAASRIVIWLYRWLLFRLIFLAGLVKLLGQDSNWQNLTALKYHYWTQPLPTWTSWYANRLPDWFQHASVIGVFYLELVVPLFFFAPRQLRRWAFVLTVGFQLLILATGNYGFFNLLAIVLCVLLLDDTFWPFRRKSAVKLLPDAPSSAPAAATSAPSSRVASAKAPHASAVAFGILSYAPNRPFPKLSRRDWIGFLRIPLAVLLIFITTVEGLYRVHYGDWIPSWAGQTAASFAGFRSANSYGLFEQMTTRRPEIIIEGSNDAKTWQAYDFKWKPGDVHRRPQFCTPHMPRLDWIMWFGGLEMEQGELDNWLVGFVRRLLQGSPQVAGLMNPSPFGEHPPRYIRATIYYYRFTTADERREDGAWWRRYKSGITTGALMLGPKGGVIRAKQIQ
jgi:predicted DCC family thiol-disulfide oxidoreductase YuxK